MSPTRRSVFYFPFRVYITLRASGLSTENFAALFIKIRAGSNNVNGKKIGLGCDISRLYARIPTLYLNRRTDVSFMRGLFKNSSSGMETLRKFVKRWVNMLYCLS